MRAEHPFWTLPCPAAKLSSVVTALRVWILLAAIVSAQGVAKVSRLAELKRLARLPEVELAPPLEFHRHAGFVVFPDASGLAIQAAELLKELKEPPPEPAGLMRLGRLYDRMGNAGLGIRFYTRAVDLFRRQLESKPEDPLPLAGLGEALGLAGRFQEALPHLERAIRNAPQNGACWQAFGRYWKERVWWAIAGAEGVYGSTRFIDAVEAFAAGGMRASELEEIEKWLGLGQAAFDRAVELEPAEAKAFEECAVFSAFAGAIRAAIRAIRSSSVPLQPFEAFLLERPVVEDLRKAAELDRSNPALLGVAALAPLFAAVYGEQLPEQLLWTSSAAARLSAADARAVSSAVTRLGALAESARKETAAAAAEMLGCIQLLVFGDSAGGRKSFRAALEASPSRSRAWDLLALDLHRSGDFRELAEHCAERVEHSPSARNAVLLAKAYAKTGDYTKAEWITLSALASHPNDFLANLSLASLIFRRPDHHLFLGRAAECIKKAERYIGPEPTRQNRLDLALTKAIHFALSGRSEQAREVLQDFQRGSGGHPEIAAALSVIGY